MMVSNSRRWMQNKYCLRFDDFPALKEGFYDIVKDPYVTRNIPLIDQNYQQRQWNDEFLLQMKLLH